MSYGERETRFSSPFRMSPPGHTGSYDLEKRCQEEGIPIPKKFGFYPDPDASLNVNTNANPRPECQAYVELNELQGDGTEEAHWQETGRWMGYEESYNFKTGTWTPAHISYLTFKSLIDLRRIILTGVILLDLEEDTLDGIIENVVTELLTKKEIHPGEHEALIKALQQKRSQSELKETSSSGTEMQTFSVSKKRDDSDSMEASVVLSGALDFLEKPVVAFVRLKDATVLHSVLEAPIPVRFLFVLVGPSEKINYHESGRAMAALMADKTFNKYAFNAENDKDLTDAIADFMDCSIVIPPTEIQNETMLRNMISFQKNMLQQRRRSLDTRLHLDDKKALKPITEPKEDPLARTGRPFGGLVKDIKRRYRHYLSDFTDALNPQVLAAIIFIYFAALSPAITFGGLLADKTEHMMGVSELMISTCVQGVIFCILAAQPILVIGFSGPLLVFEEAFFGFCKSQGIEYIVGRVWVGVWLIIIVVVIVAAEGSVLVRYISRFTQEIFSILISLIFIYETFAKLIRIFAAHPLILNYEYLNETVEDPFHPVYEQHHHHDNETGNVTVHHRLRERAYPNTALLSMCLMFGCFFIAYFLRQFKNGHFLPGPLRRVIGDFGVPIAIFFMIAVDISIEDAYTQKLLVPKGLTVSNTSARGWFINPLGEKKDFPIWMMVASIVPAILVFILIFLESQITTLIVSKPERKMVKGSGFHLDLLILVSMGGISALFGVPWLSAATVRTVTHANALTVMSKGPKPEIEKVLEQRISGMMVALLVGVSILMEPILKMIPMTALFGIFLYMGITSLSGIQLWDRILLFLTPKKYFPSDAYATVVKPLRIHLFTLIQVVCLVILWVVKSSTFSLALPFVLILTIPLRVFMTGRLFTEKEMKCLDADNAKVTLEEEPGEDVYTESPLP